MWVMDLPLARVGDPAPARRERLGYRSNLHDLRPGRPDPAYVKACLEELDRDPKQFVPAGIHTRSRTRRTGSSARGVRAARSRSFYDQTVAGGVPTSTNARSSPRTPSTSTISSSYGASCSNGVPDVARALAEACRYILVDEYQDTNHAQYRSLQLLAGEHRNICVVGDPTTSPSTRFAAPTSATSSSSSRTSRGRRSSRSSRTTARRSDPRGRERGDREQPRAQAEGALERARRGRSGPRRRGGGRARRGRLVAAEIVRLVDEGFSGAEIAIFYRTNAQSRVIEDVPARNESPTR